MPIAQYGCYTRHTIFEVDCPQGEDEDPEAHMAFQLPGCPLCRKEECKPHWYAENRGLWGQTEDITVNGHRVTLWRCSSDKYEQVWLTMKDGETIHFVNLIYEKRPDGMVNRLTSGQWVFSPPVSIGIMGHRFYVWGVHIFTAAFYTTVNGNKVLVE